MKLHRRTPQRSRERGFSIVENLIAIGLLGIVIVGSARLHIYTLQANGTAQDYSTLNDEAQALVDNYRGQGFDALLARFGGSRTAIANGATVSETTPSVSPKIAYVTTFTAIAAASGGAPQAIHVRIEATQQRGALGEHVFSYETIIAHTA